MCGYKYCFNLYYLELYNTLSVNQVFSTNSTKRIPLKVLKVLKIAFHVYTISLDFKFSYITKYQQLQHLDSITNILLEKLMYSVYAFSYAF